MAAPQPPPSSVAVPQPPPEAPAAAPPGSSAAARAAGPEPETGSFQLSGGRNGNERGSLEDWHLQLSTYLPPDICDRYRDSGFKDESGRMRDLYPWQVGRPGGKGRPLESRAPA